MIETRYICDVCGKDAVGDYQTIQFVQYQWTLKSRVGNELNNNTLIICSDHAGVAKMQDLTLTIAAKNLV